MQESKQKQSIIRNRLAHVHSTDPHQTKQRNTRKLGTSKLKKMKVAVTSNYGKLRAGGS